MYCTNVVARVRGASNSVLVMKYVNALYVPVAYSLINIGLSNGNMIYYLKKKKKEGRLVVLV
jgi:hypothetical protein